MKMEERMVVLRALLILTVTVPLSSAAKHSLQYFYTAVTQGINFPEFTAVGMVDGGQFMYYDSKERNTVPKTEWIKKIDDDDPGYWDRETNIAQGNQEVSKVNVQTLMQRFNHTKGVHTFQIMYGCELDEDGTKRVYEQFGYDGEDFLSLDLKTETWIAPVSQAFSTREEWERTGTGKYQATYLENICIEWLQKYVGYGRDTLERKVRPEVSLFQKDSSSPVVCHATGFFPKAVMISWQKNGEDLNEDVELRETLTNQDGTFQKRSILTVSPEELKNNKYSCVVQHSSLEKELVLQMSECRVLSGSVGPVGVSVDVLVGVGVVVAVLLLVLIACVVRVIWKMKKSGFKPVPGSRESSTSNLSSDSVQSTVSSTDGLIPH